MKPVETNPQHILVIGEIQDISIWFDTELTLGNIHIIQANSTQEASDILTNTDISLVILDTHISDSNCDKFLEHLRSNAVTQFIPAILVVNAEQTDSSLLDYYRDGTIDIVPKPVQAELLISRVNTRLAMDQQRRQIAQHQSELDEATQRLKHYAQYDQLTGLLNREQMTNILARMMANSRRSETRLGLIFLDLDHFKRINDTVGHAIGDMLLKSIAQRLGSSVREDDFIARLGGDEFAIIVSNLETDESASIIAQRILDSLVIPHRLNHHEILISSSIGIAIYDEQNKTASELLKSAESAMYLAKTKGRSQFAYFSPELELKALRRIEIARDLNYAIDNNELSVFFQPQISAINGKVIGFEALMRWQKNQEWIGPDIFIPVAEETGLIPKLGEWILLESCKQLKQWQDQKLFKRNVKISVNISSRQIQSRQFVVVLKNALKTSGLAPECLELELTESTVMDDPDTSISIFHEIHQLGVEIAVDDFGTGYSSLAYLRRLPLDRLKIDRSFVNDIDIDRNSEAIVKAIIGLSHNLGLSVVAEGVETEEQSAFLQQNQCDTLQGYLFARPMAAADIPEYLQRN